MRTKGNLIVTLSNRGRLLDFKMLVEVEGKEYEVAKESYPISGYAPGNYSNKCAICKKDFKGDKYARACLLCIRPHIGEVAGTIVQRTIEGEKVEQFIIETYEQI